jgi:hypothetical protein
MPRKPKPPLVLSRGSVSTEFDGKTYTASYTVRDDATVEVLCRYGHRRARTLQGAPGQVVPQDGFAKQLLDEIIGEAARNGRLDPQGDAETNQVETPAAARPKMRPVPKQLGKFYYAIRCENCQEFLPLVEVPPLSSDEKATSERFKGFIVRCDSCVRDTLVEGPLSILAIR